METECGSIDCQIISLKIYYEQNEAIEQYYYSQLDALDKDVRILIQSVLNVVGEWLIKRERIAANAIPHRRTRFWVESSSAQLRYLRIKG